MNSLSLLVSLALLGAASAVILDIDYEKSVGQMNTLRKCLGDEATLQWYYPLVGEAMNHCERETAAGARFDDVEDNFFKQYTDNVRSKRNVPYPPENLDVSRFRCMMQRIGITDSQNNVDAASIKRLYSEVRMSPDLLENLHIGVDVCSDYAKCLPLDYHTVLRLPKDVIRVKAYLSCQRMIRQQSCALEDAKNFAGSMDLSGAGSNLDFLPNKAAKAAAIFSAWGVVGSNDFDLFQ